MRDQRERCSSAPRPATVAPAGPPQPSVVYVLLEKGCGFGLSGVCPATSEG